jgi:hypothetical protein
MSKIVFKGKSPKGLDIQATGFWLLPNEDCYKSGISNFGLLVVPDAAIGTVSTAGTELKIDAEFETKKNCQIEISIFHAIAAETLVLVESFFLDPCHETEFGLAMEILAGDQFAVLVRSTCDDNKVCKAKVTLRVLTP